MVQGINRKVDSYSAGQENSSLLKPEPSTGAYLKPAEYIPQLYTLFLQNTF